MILPVIKKVKVGKLNFELTTPAQEGELPSLEVENEASIIFEKIGQ